MYWKNHVAIAGAYELNKAFIPHAGDEEFERFVFEQRRRIEPWLSAVFQAEHLNVLLGSGFTRAVAGLAGVDATGMDKVTFGTELDERIDQHAAESAKRMKRDVANLEDQLRSAFALLEGLDVLGDGRVPGLRAALNREIGGFLSSLLTTEQRIANPGDDRARNEAERTLQSFLLSFASRAASRERLHLFTTNYDRLIEHGCDLAGLRVIDRFVGALSPVFRASRMEVDLHYNPPGIRGEPRYMEGVVRLTKLHGSLDWRYSPEDRRIFRQGIPFGAPSDHTDVPKSPVDTVMIYPNAAKDVDTGQYPYAELFRDFAASVCRPNSVVVTYGYGFGDDHINRVLRDMLTIPSTHLVLISYDNTARLDEFTSTIGRAQLTLLIGDHFAHISNLTEHYLPKPALDYITGRMTELVNRRGDMAPSDELPSPPIEPGSGLAPAVKERRGRKGRTDA